MHEYSRVWKTCPFDGITYTHTKGPKEYEFVFSVPDFVSQLWTKIGKERLVRFLVM